MNKSFLVSTLSAAAAAMLFAGCATKTSYVEPGGSRLVTSVGKIDIQDFASAADTMTQSLIDNLINQGKLKSGVADEPALMAISLIQNNTGQQLDTDLLVKKIRIALNRTGKVQTSTTIGIGAPEDPLAADQQRSRELFSADKKQPRPADYTLSGKIIEVRDRAGNIRQSSYVFQLSLSSSSGIAVWEEEKTITKQGSKGSVGF
jgi:penicillin-binding protein activator